MTRIEELDDSSLRAVLDDDGKLTGVIDRAGRGTTFVASTKTITGSVELSSLDQAWTLQQFHDFEKHLSIAGFVGTGISDDSAAIQEALLAYLEPAKRKLVKFPSGVETVRIDSGLTIPFVQCSIDFHGVTIDASNMTSGTAISLVGQNVVPYNIRSNSNVLDGLVLLGPDTDETAVDGIAIGGVDATLPGHGSIMNTFVSGFRDNMVMGDNFYISTLRNLHLLKGHRYGLNYTGATNSGENISIFGGSISDCANAGGTAVSLYVPSSAAGPDLILYGVSFSYSDIAFDINGGATNLNGCHFENKTNNPMGKIKYVGGRPSTAVVISGGQLTHGTLGSGVENSNGRPAMFVIDSTTGDRVMFSIRDLRYNAFGKKETELVKFTGAAFPLVSVKAIEVAASGGAVGRISDFTNLVYNGGFETGKTNGWTNSDGTNTVTQDATVFNTDAAGSAGTKSLKVVGASAGTTIYSQTFSGVRSGDKILARGFMRVDSVSAGNLTIKLYFLAQDGTTISTSTLGTQSANTAWTLYGNYYRCVAGVASVKIEVAANGFTGTGYFDDIGVWVV